MIISVIVVAAVFSFLSDKFLTSDSFASILTMTAELGIMAVGTAFLMISGEFDLSVGSAFALAPLTLGLLMIGGLDPIIGFPIVLGLLLFIGLFNGLITLKMHLPSFIMTLGMMMFLRGVVFAITKGFPIEFGGSDLFRQALAGRFVKMFRISSVWSVITCLVFTIILIRTRYGNWVFAVGGGKETARSMGVSVDKVKLINFMLCAVLAGFAGIIAFARLGIVAPTSGEGMELEAIAAAVVGGCLLGGGYGSIPGAFLGAFLIAMIRNGLVLVGAPPYYYSGFIGMILVIASIIHLTIRRRTLG